MNGVSLEGTRTTRRVIQRPEDWEQPRCARPRERLPGRPAECLNLVVRGWPDVPVLQTIFNPLSQAKNLVGREELLIHLRRYPEALKVGLHTIAQSTQRFVEAALKQASPESSSPSSTPNSATVR
jgi:uroporphyrinogen decarboxylase